ncbi:cytochrome b/b6 domain-containing protein [Mariprofundus ferrooxydans]|uniref:cytochrome b/b6 domain-containing protein n=1 Tax=Mariprofundus ferrooxydans TaxID=314344 RepID=UPI00036FD82A|nr:cytochrome b/b6 domain-containing protein [Mariprofundus ferrooxydans]
MTEQAYAKPIRLLHSLLALCMLSQIAIGELMDVPEVEDKPAVSVIEWIMPAYAHEGHHQAVPGAPVEATLGFEVHEILGLVIGGLLLIRIMLALTSLPGANWRQLVPWVFADGRKQLAGEIRVQMAGWKQAKLAPPEDGEAVARSVHGLILIAGIIMGMSGTILYFGWSQTAPQTAFIELVASTHELVVGVLEALLGAHVLAVILHQRMGHNILARIKPGG